jgi:hypothetical protein
LEYDVRGDAESNRRVLLNLKIGRAEVRDDLLCDYIRGRLSWRVAAAVAARAVVDARTARRIEDLRSALDLIASEIMLPDDDLSPDLRRFIQQMAKPSDKQ